MKGLKFTEQTSRVAICLFAIYAIYGFMYMPLMEYMVTLLLGGIAYGLTKSYEITLFAVLASTFVFHMLNPKPVEGFVLQESQPGPLVHEEPEVPKVKSKGVVGVTSPMSEGFESTSSTSGVIDTVSTKDTTATVPSNPGSAPANANDVVKNEPVPKSLSEQKVPAVTQPAETFEDSGSLFKLGQIPKDEKGGFHIDSGTSILNALKSLKPDQIAAMTQDTQQLIQTQKSLMNMLQSMKPLMSEGKDMMATFQTMFSPTSTAPGSIGGALDAAKQVS